MSLKTLKSTETFAAWFISMVTTVSMTYIAKFINAMTEGHAAHAAVSTTMLIIVLMSTSVTISLAIMTAVATFKEIATTRDNKTRDNRDGHTQAKATVIPLRTAAGMTISRPNAERAVPNLRLIKGGSAEKNVS